jgi:hypothetical protein
MLVATLIGAGVAVLTTGGGTPPIHELARALPAVSVEVRAPDRPVTPSALATEPTASQVPTRTPVLAVEAAAPSLPAVASPKRSPPASKREPRIPQVVRE